MISVLIVDGDGVTILGKSFSERLLREFAVDPVKEKEFFSTTFQDCVLGKADLKEVIVPYLQPFGWTGRADDFLDYWFTKEWELNQKLVSYIGRLRKTGVRVVMATNQEAHRAQYILETMHLGGVFDKIYFSCDIGLKKPTDSYLNHILQDQGVSKDEVVFWDDEQRSIKSARNFGIRAELYTDFDAFERTMTQAYHIASS